MVKVNNLRTEAMVNPLGITVLQPRLTWMLESGERCVKQKAFRVLIAGSDEKLFHDSGYVYSDENQYLLPDRIEISGKRFLWKVFIIDDRDRTWESSEYAWFEMGMLHAEDWTARWIEPEQIPVDHDYMDNLMERNNSDIREETLYPCPEIRKSFMINKTVKQARIYATAHGVYRLFLNGKRVGTYELSPEPTCYEKYLQVQTYDVTDLLSGGENVIGAVLGDGWWAGGVGCFGEAAQYGDLLGLLLQCEMEYEDGTKEVYGTDGSWKSSFGPRRYSDLLIGEKYDSHYEHPGWCSAGFDDTGWKDVNVAEYGYENLVGQNAPHICVLDTDEKYWIYTSPKGEMIIDCYQVKAGNAVMHIKGMPYTCIEFDYFEEPDKDGNYYWDFDGRRSVQRDTYVLDETGEGNYEPWFTIHAYRYIRVRTSAGEIEVTNFLSRLIASDLEVTSKLETSHAGLNRLFKNMEWTLRSNCVGIPTDNPDRERVGYVGDFAMSAPAEVYMMNMEGFTKRFMEQVRYDQLENGIIPQISPLWKTFKDHADVTGMGWVGWSDGAVLLPWLAYQFFGDKRILLENYEALKKWISYLEEQAKSENPDDIGEMTPERMERLKYIRNTGFNVGDWMTPSTKYNQETGEYCYWVPSTLGYLTGTYYYAYCTEVMEQIACELGKTQDAAYYKELNQKIREAAIEEFYNSGKIIESEFMGAQVLALHMGFYPEGDRQKVVDRLCQLIREKGMDTGFTSTTEVLNVLEKNGCVDEAYDYLLNEKFPSWLYQVNCGATGIWEDMNCITPDGERHGSSFIQAVFSSIGGWMMRSMGGIQEELPGYKKIRIAPLITGKLDYVNASYHSSQGKIISNWELDGKQVKLQIQIPANTTASVFLAEAASNEIMESGIPVTEAEGVVNVEEHNHGVLIEVGSGDYSFVYERKVI